MTLIEKALEKNRIAARESGPTVVTHSTPTPVNLPAPMPPEARAERQRRIRVDLHALRAAGILAPPEFRQRHSAEVRTIKRRVLRELHKDPEQRRRVIMLASSLPGEGKTFSSVNLALSLAAEKDFHVLLVDGDVAKPNVSRIFGLESSPGLLDATRDEAIDVETLVVGTNLASLDLLPAGTWAENATESLSSIRMREIIGQLVSMPDRIVVIDSPPLLITTEAAALAEHAGQVLLVVRANSTPQRAVLDAIAVLGERDGVSILLNDVTGASFDQLYYGYERNYGYGDRTASASEDRSPDA